VQELMETIGGYIEQVELGTLTAAEAEVSIRTFVALR